MEVKFQDRKHMSEIYNAGLEYSLLNNDLEGIHPPIRCKDFLGDAFWSEHRGEKISIFGFQWEPGMISLTQGIYRMGIRLKDTKLDKYAKNLESFLNAWENVLRIPESKVTPTNDGEYLLIESNREWYASPIRISLYSLFLRVGLTYTGSSPMSFLQEFADEKHEPLGKNDPRYVKQAFSKIENIWKNGFPNQTFEEFKGVAGVHSSSGIVHYVIKEA